MLRTLVPVALCSALTLAVAGLASAASVDSKGGRDFLRSAISGDNGEIALGRLGMRRASSQDVRAFARLLVVDHQRSRELALELGRDIDTAAPTAPSAEAEAELRKLKGLSGRAFDREFVRYMAADHRKDVREFRAQAARRQGRVSRLAQMAVPTLRKHLRMAEALAPKVGLRSAVVARQP